MWYVEGILVIIVLIIVLVGFIFLLHHLHEQLLKLCAGLCIDQRLGIGTLGTYQQGECCRQIHTIVGHHIDKRYDRQGFFILFVEHLATDVGQISHVVVVEHTSRDALWLTRVEEYGLPAVGHSLSDASRSTGLRTGFSIFHLGPLGLRILDDFLGSRAKELQIEAVRQDRGGAVGKGKAWQMVIPYVQQLVVDGLGRNSVVGGEEIAYIHDGLIACDAMVGGRFDGDGTAVFVA